MENEAKNPIKSVHTSFRLLEALSRSSGMGVSELAREIDVTKGTVHNHLSTLRERGYVVQRANEYHLGSRLIGFGTAIRDRSPLYRHSRDILTSLAQSTGEAACIAVEEEGYVVYQRIVPEETDAERLLSEGCRLPLHCSAPGKCLLADRTNDEIREYLSNYTGLKLPERTTSDPDELVEEIRTVREQNLGFARGEYTDELYEVATPVSAGGERTRGAVGVFGPKERMSGKALQQDTAGLVLNAAKRVEVAIHRASV